MTVQAHLDKKYPHSGGQKPFNQIMSNDRFNYEDKVFELKQAYAVGMTTANRWMNAYKQERSIDGIKNGATIEQDN